MESLTGRKLVVTEVSITRLRCHAIVGTPPCELAPESTPTAGELSFILSSSPFIIIRGAGAGGGGGGVGGNEVELSSPCCAPNCTVFTPPAHFNLGLL